MQKIFKTLVVTLSLVSLLVGCGGENKKLKTSLKFSFWGSSEELASIQTVTKQYEASHPDIQIETMHIPDNYFQKLHILMASDLTPDIMMLNSFYIPVYAEAQKLLPLKINFSQEYYPQTIKALSYQNQLYAYPRDVSDLVVYVNLDLLKKNKLARPKNNWRMQDMLKIAQRIAKTQNTYGISFSDKPLFWLPYVWSNGGSLSQLDSTKSCEALQFNADLVNQYHVAPSPKQIGSQGMSQLFSNGQLAFFISGRWSVPFLRKSANFNWDVLPFPSGHSGKIYKSIVGIDASGYAVSAQTHYQKEAKDFARYLTSSKALSALTQSGLILPARKNLAESTLFLNPKLVPKNNLAFISAIHHGQPTHVPSNWNELSEALGLELAPMWSGESKACELLPTVLPKLKKEFGGF